MKTLKTLLSLFALVAVFSAEAFAQETENITAKAEVITSVTIEDGSPGARGLDFGLMFAGDSKTIAADSSAAGIFKVSNLAEDMSVNVQVEFPTELSNSTETMATNSYATNYSLGTTVDPETPTGQPGQTSSSQSFDVDTDTNTQLNIFVGMGVTTVANQAGGIYTGDITLTLYYN